MSFRDSQGRFNGSQDVSKEFLLAPLTFQGILVAPGGLGGFRRGPGTIWGQAATQGRSRWSQGHFREFQGYYSGSMGDSEGICRSQERLGSFRGPMGFHGGSRGLQGVSGTYQEISGAFQGGPIQGVARGTGRFRRRSRGSDGHLMGLRGVSGGLSGASGGMRGIPEGIRGVLGASLEHFRGFYGVSDGQDAPRGLMRTFLGVTRDFRGVPTGIWVA